MILHRMSTGFEAPPRMAIAAAARIVVFVALGAVMVACSPPPAGRVDASGSLDPALAKTREELAREAFEVGGHQKRMVQVVRQALAPLGNDQRVMAVIDEEVAAAMPKVTEGVAQIYAEQFTAQELSDIVAFFQSSGGRAFLLKQGEIARQVQPLAEDFGRSVTERVVRRVRGGPPAATPPDAAVLNPAPPSPSP